MKLGGIRLTARITICAMLALIVGGWALPAAVGAGTLSYNELASYQFVREVMATNLLTQSDFDNWLDDVETWLNSESQTTGRALTEQNRDFYVSDTELVKLGYDTFAPQYDDTNTMQATKNVNVFAAIRKSPSFEDFLKTYTGTIPDSYRDFLNGVFNLVAGVNGGDGALGGGGSASASVNFEVAQYKPAAGAVDVAINAAVELTFDQQVQPGDLTRVVIVSGAGQQAGGVVASVDGSKLSIKHDDFGYNTVYTVTVPEGAVKSQDGGTAGDQVSWSFTTIKQAAVPAPLERVTLFTDVTPLHWAFSSIDSLSAKGFISGYPDQTFRPEQSITRAEFISIIAKLLDLPATGLPAPGFSDVQSGAWYADSVAAAVYAGLAHGDADGGFRPDDPINRQELAAILVAALGKQTEAAAGSAKATTFADDKSIAGWARGFVWYIQNIGLIKGYPDNTYGPGNSSTRAEICAVLNNFLAISGQGSVT